MSETEKLLSSVSEYCELCDWLEQNHPDVLDNWRIKSKNAGVSGQQQQAHQSILDQSSESTNAKIR